jgi:hypothetical protein
MKRIGQIIGAAIVGIFCVCMLPIIIPFIIVYTIFAVIKAIFVAIMAATVIKAKGDSL